MTGQKYNYTAKVSSQNLVTFFITKDVFSDPFESFLEAEKDSQKADAREGTLLTVRRW